MKNAINFYYNLKIEKIYNNNNYYYFYYNNHLYILKSYNNDLSNINNIYNLNVKLISLNIPIHQIMLNKDMSIISMIDNNYYLLYKVMIKNYNNKITIKDLNYLNNTIIDNNITNNWPDLWATRIDYLEYQVNQTGKKYPIIVESFSYFVGLTENAISYAKNTIIDSINNYNNIGVISHKNININDTLFNFYDPLNIIVDNKIRDLAEYIKNSFFQDNFEIFKELNYYFSKNYLSIYDIRLLFARILYPSFYFKLYDSIISGQKEEKELLKVTSRINDYEQYLYEIFLYLKKFYFIPEIDWLKKRRTSLLH